MKRTIRFSVLAFTLAALLSIPLQAWAVDMNDAPRIFHTQRGAEAYTKYMDSQPAVPNEAQQLAVDTIDSPRVFHTKNGTEAYTKYMDSQPAIPGQLSMAPRSDSDKMVSAATQIFKEAAMKPSQSIPAPVIKNAAGIAIFPGRARVTQAKGGTYRSGVMLSRRNNGKWSSPVFVSLAGNNIQSKPGSTSRDVVLIFNNRNALNRAAKGNGFTLGVDATLAQGYIGAKAPAAGTAAQVLAYQRTNGRFSGASLKGSALNIEPNRTIAYYNLTEGTAGAHGYYRSSSEGVYNKIIGSSDSAERIERHPANADHLRQALRDYVSQAHSSM